MRRCCECNATPRTQLNQSERDMFKEAGMYVRCEGMCSVACRYAAVESGRADVVELLLVSRRSANSRGALPA